MDDMLTLPEVPGDEYELPDIEPTYGPNIRCEGRYEIDPIPGGKRFQGSWLVLDDGTRYVLSYRPTPEYFRFVDKRVQVTGRSYTPGRDTQHIHAKHFQLQNIELAPGETPRTDNLDQVPAPPLLYTMDEIRKRVGTWGQVVGELTALEDDVNTHFETAYLKLKDATKIAARYAAAHLWRPYMHKLITVMSRIETVEESGHRKVILSGWYALCSGVVNRCGMQVEFP